MSTFLINGDGAKWIKQGKEYFLKAHIYLDHLKLI
ncbi:UPF0236 family transposase-like protein [Thermanaeromonas toyohensis]